jgi:hypothetical protein
LPDVWENEEWEQSIAAELITLHINETEFNVGYRCVAMFSLHSLARRIQRSINNDSKAIFADMVEVVAHHERVLAASKPEFTVGCRSGRWRGLRVAATLKAHEPDLPVLSVRTFVGSPFRLIQSDVLAA